MVSVLVMRVHTFHNVRNLFVVKVRKVTQVMTPNNVPSARDDAQLTILAHLLHALLYLVYRLVQSVSHVRGSYRLLGVGYDFQNGFTDFACPVLFGVANYCPARRLGVPLQGVLCRLLDVPAVHMQHGIGLSPITL